MDSGSSGIVKRGASPSPARVSSAPYCRDTSPTTWWGTRSSTVTSVASYSFAVRSRCQGTASAYRDAVVTMTHTSAAQINSAASARLPATSESMSGASSSASPRGRFAATSTRSAPLVAPCGSGVPSSPVSSCCGSHTRVRRGSTRSPANQWWSSGWQTRTGVRVVGRSTPASLTRRPTSELTSVDFPAPVDPPITASRGASGALSRGTR